MATIDFNQPVVTDTRTLVLQYIREHFSAQARMYESGDTLANTPTGLIKYNGSSDRFEQWDGAAFVPLPLAEVNNGFAVKAAGALGLSVQNGSGTPWAIELLRTDLGLRSRVQNSTGTAWAFEHRPTFAGNTPWDSGNFVPSGYAPIADPIFTTRVRQSATGVRYWQLDSTGAGANLKKSRLQHETDGTVRIGPVLDDESAFITTRMLQILPSNTLQFGGFTVWHSGNDGTGSGLDANLMNGLAADTAATANTMAQRDASGNIFANYLSSASANAENPAVSQLLVTNGGDGVLRKASLAHIRNQLPLSSLSNDAGFITPNYGSTITAGFGGTVGQSRLTVGDATHTGFLGLHQPNGTRQGYIGYATAGGRINLVNDTSNGFQFTGGTVLSNSVFIGNSGSKGFGGITTTASTTPPSGGSSGDFHLIY